MDDMRDRLTVLTLTYNRYPLLSRLLRYYQLCGAPFPLLILDSSSDARGSEGLAGWLRAPGMTHVPYDPSIPPTAKLEDGMTRVTTPYVVVWADDDLMVPRAMAAGVRFLDAHPEFSAAHGVSGLFQVGVERGRQVLAGVEPYPQSASTEETASQRLLHYLSDYTTLFYSVQRTSGLVVNLRRYRASGLGGSGTAGPVHPEHQGTTRAIGMSPHLGVVQETTSLGRVGLHRSDWWVELGLACLCVIQGKVQRLDGLYMLRERHPGIDSWKEGGEAGKRLDVFDWVTCTSFARAYGAFQACLSEPLADQDSISVAQAQAVVKQAFWSYLSRALLKKWNIQYGRRGMPIPLRSLGEAVRRSPMLHRGWRAVRSRMPGQGLAVESLCQSSSPFYADFMPIYRAITSPPSEPVVTVGDQEKGDSLTAETALHG